MKRTWKGDGSETLEEFFALHRNCNTTMDNGNEIVGCIYNRRIVRIKGYELHLDVTPNIPKEN